MTLVLALDLAVRTGFCIGHCGEQPRVGAVRMKQPSEPPDVAVGNVAHFLRDMWVLELPDLMIIEAPLPAAAFRSADSAEMALGMVGAAIAMASVYGVRLEKGNAQTVSRHFTGKARWSEAEGGRKAKKAAAIARARLLGYIASDEKDDPDMADAIACWDYACARFCRMQPRELHMFGEQA
jgi:hypothetical protein